MFRWAGGAPLPPAPPSPAPGMRGEDAVDKRGKGASSGAERLAKGSQGDPSVRCGGQLPLHRGAMGSRCPPGVDRLVFCLIGRRYFGGRGELRSPLSSHRNVFSKHPGVPVGLFSTKSTQYSLLQNARPPGSLRSPSDAAPKCATRVLWTSGERAPQGGRQIKRNARVFPAFLLLYSVVRSADRTGFPDARRSGGAGGRRRQRARRSRRRRG